MDVSQVRLEWPTDLAVNPMDNSLYILENNVILRITENHQVSIIAGRPMHCQVPGIDYSLSKLAIHAALESATAIALSHTGVLYIAETDEKKINRVRQVSTNGEISLLAGAPRRTATARMTSTATVSTATMATHPTPASTPPGRSPSHPTERFSSPILTTYASEPDGQHLQTVSLITGEPLYNFTYGPDRELATVVDNCNNTIRVRRDGLGQGGSSGLLRLVLLPENQVVTLGLDPAGGLKSVSARDRRWPYWGTLGVQDYWPPRLTRPDGPPSTSMTVRVV
ncbi:hypothetical protein J4Q44_G00389930 [Coregonus suidteri]|uniref:Teneurin NHL domain-containing protein n=1 Tax=Coregonus suidteri TaxID=861788 RepID=A0AAN8KKD1_9TELE